MRGRRATRTLGATVLVLVGGSALWSRPPGGSGASRGVAGLLAEDATWSRADSPIVVTGDVAVAYGVTLTIEAGVEVRFDGDHTLAVHGTLNAEGAPGNEITWVVDGRPVLRLDKPTVVVGRPETGARSAETPVVAQDLSFDAATGEIRFTLPQPARVRARIGVRDGGPWLRTLLDWEPRAAGKHVEVWDGRDRTGTVDFGQRRDLKLALVCLPERPGGAVLEPVRGRRKALRLTITFPGATETDGEGVAVLRGAAPVRVTLAAEDHSWLKGMGFEVGLYVDTEFLMEQEEGTSPFDYLLDTASLPAGPHSMTANVIGFEGEVGTESVRFLVGGTAGGHPGEERE